MSEDRGFRNALVSRFCKVGHTIHADGALVIVIRMMTAYLIFVIFFTRAKFLENKIYTEKTRKLRQNTQ